ncbi:hypothetical protein [Tenacibaculum finnmarkense]|uniref:hypothetical protein n=1 Tax=Tenacibaculum finnmarkense TaxID=2781243 RepID=UPI001E5A7E44|nr:hypothetical protein [Tenacibaculum finnmarkense]MCD8444654.1 hypothetical protein [Tenacibaculum finnmarkense genomovar ulcerans]MCG8802830.1 hypothetical protein [Tenacibaculum finnmarkense]MCG8825558.1 hypothetical protein [Tenacibaculum finnmarkense]MCG8858729.1 hypothetical protein [Tenacibaculum finnmarkense]
MKKTNSFKLAMVAVGMLTIGTVSAQQIDATNADLAKQATAVKSVDNKGTIKHVQVANGLTEATDAATNVTTFQLGGDLVAPTTVTADATNYFAVKGITGVSAADMVGADLNLKPAANFGAAGLTLMVRDETTGEIKKLLAADVAAYLETLAKNVYETKKIVGVPAPADYTIAVADLPIALLLKPARLFVYRNGVKLLQSDVTVNPAGGELTISGVTLFDEDIIEVQYTN